MLRLVHPPSGGNGTDPPKRRKGTRSAALMLTREEAQHFRASLRNLARAYGTWGCLAQVIGVPVETLHQAMKPRRRPSGVLVIRAAKAGGTTVEAVLTGQLTMTGRCKAC